MKDFIYLAGSSEPIERIGGPVFYSLKAAERLNSPFKLFPMLGHDGASLLREFEGRGFEVEPIWIKRTPQCVLRYRDQKGDQRTVELEVEPEFPSDFDTIVRQKASIELLHFGTATPFDVDRSILERFFNDGFTLSIDMQGPTRAAEVDASRWLDWMPYLTVVKVDLDEGELMTGLTTPQAIAEDLFQRGAKEVLVTLGSRGLWLCTDGLSCAVEAQRVEAAGRDATGCGDLFTTTYLAYRHQGLRQAAVLATKLVAEYLRGDF